METLPGAARGNDARALMLFEANKKSTLIAYLLWFFVGSLGGHRFYSQRTGSAIAILLLTVGGFVLSVVGIGFLLLGIMGIWVLVDAFLIPGWIRDYNNQLVQQLAG